MDVINFVYNDVAIDFQLSGKDNVMVNATQMAKVFGKLPKDFLILDNTKNFILACKKKENSPFIFIESDDDLVKSIQKSGTFMHRILALKFAAWLDPNFELWIFSTIDRILNEYFRDQRQRMVQTENLKAKIAARKQELISQVPDFADIFEMEAELRAIKGESAKATRKEQRKIQLELAF